MMRTRKNRVGRVRQNVMKIQLILYASLAHHMPPEAKENSGYLEVEDDATIGGLMNRLEIPAESAKVIFLNGRHAKWEQTVQEGDRVAVFPPVAGG